ncbi:hypothetical protein BDY19DRAFT_946382 [Irpex rosettiformis]|uniref:Uncharacterized protein n=1 Tax=Irpex rosettiformis TaxID=378272 RepID=A0ACB8U3T9_9APHY|nr:hypothetical protein BDY19DRAFT_946382 [Irpex rosettiformis]
MVGYFVFPPTTSPFPVLEYPQVPPSSDAGVRSQATTSSTDASKTSKEDEVRKAQRLKYEATRQARLEYERQQIYLSELEWVRSGGALRDANGRRDKARTEEFKKEIRLQNEEKEILERWKVYEGRLRALQTAPESFIMEWDSIPWPMPNHPSSHIDITTTAVSEFIFATFRVRGVRAVRKERLRTSILRWHPDKYTALLLRIPEPEQRAFILEGVNAVFRALRELQGEDRQPSV